MTASNTCTDDLAAQGARGVDESPPDEGAGNAGADALAAKNTRVVRHGHTGITRHSPRNGLRLIRALPGDLELFVTVVSAS